MSEIAPSFEHVRAALTGLAHHRVDTLTSVSHHGKHWPLVVVHPHRWDSARKPILIAGGVHGDEPAGVYAALTLLAEADRADYVGPPLVIFPCVNPSGFDAGTLTSGSGANLNRLFGTRSEEPEVRAIEEWLQTQGLTFRMAFDLHEVRPDYAGEGFTAKDNPLGAYLYEIVIDGSPRLGRAMIDALPSDRAVCDWPTIYEDVNTGGVITYPQDRRNPIYAQGTSLDAFLSSEYTGHAFTTETPTGWSMPQRVDTHVTFVKTALRLAV